MYEFFWMCSGAATAWILSYFYRNQKFREGLKEAVSSARTDLKNKL